MTPTPALHDRGSPSGGPNPYFGKPFKLQINWERIDPEGDGADESAFRIQSQLVY